MPAVTLMLSKKDTPHETVKRKLGALNVGLYCEHCGEFFALAVLHPQQESQDIGYGSDGPVLFRCPMCEQNQFREASQIQTVRLSESNKRR